MFPFDEFQIIINQSPVLQVVIGCFERMINQTQMVFGLYDAMRNPGIVNEVTENTPNHPLIIVQGKVPPKISFKVRRIEIFYNIIIKLRFFQGSVR